MRRLLAICLLAVLLPSPGTAQDVDAARAFNTGAYEDARRAYRSLLEDAGARSTPYAVPYAETFLMVGDYEEGLQAVEGYLAEAPNDPFLLHAKGRLLAAVGQYDEAENAYRQAGQGKPDFWRNALELGMLLEERGQKRQAFTLYAAIYRPYKAGRFRTAEELGIAGWASARLEEFYDANEAFRTAYRLDAGNVQNLYWWAEVFREKYNNADATRTFEEAFALNERHAGLYVGYARVGGGFARQEELARKALEANPNHVSALAILAELRILDGLYEEAEGFIEQALAVNPSAVLALAQLASVHHLRGDTTALAAVEKRVLSVSPRPADYYLSLSENAMRRFRYPDAEAFSRKAVAADNSNAKALASLGTSLLRTGKFREARRYLDASFDRDPFNLFVGNTLTLLDEYENFDLLESEHFTLLIHRDEREVLGASMLALAEEAYDAMSARYPYRPEGKILLEAYNDPDDFAVRIAGVPHLGLLGVSFGDVVALNTPQAQAGRPYNYARTLWHELAHTMAIGLSGFQVPRWFTEGLSVYEERRAREEWGREMDLDLFAAFDDGKLLPLAEIDKGFTRPTFQGQVLLSYYHASKVIAFIVEQQGFEAVTSILQTLGEGQDIATSIERVLQQDVATLDEAFRADLKRQRDQFAQVLVGMPSALSDEEEVPNVLEKITGRSANPFFQLLQDGLAHLRESRFEAAVSAYEEALELYPYYIGGGNAYEGLAAAYRAQGAPDKLMDILERFLEISEFGVEAARELGGLHAEAGTLDRAAYYLRRTLDVEPYDKETRLRLAEVYDKAQRFAEAAEQRRALLALDPVDRAQAYYQLAVSLYMDNRVTDAKRAVLQSLELAPGYRDAQKLLLKCVEP